MKKYNISVNGTTYAVEVEEAGGVATAAPASHATAPVAASPVAAAAPVLAPVATATAPAEAPSADLTVISSPMPGTIWEVVATVGQAVKEGDVLLILEAMKMENEIMAPYAGTVESISVAKGAAVNTGDVLVTLK